jgi:cytidylate kinase
VLANGDSYSTNRDQNPDRRARYGCGGGTIAWKIADRLGWTLWDGALTSEVARLSHCDRAELETREEHVDPVVPAVQIDHARQLRRQSECPSAEAPGCRSIFRITERVVQQAAAGGNCVIVGRGSRHFLRDRADTVRVFRYASREERVRRLVSDGVSEKDEAIQHASVTGETPAEFCTSGCRVALFLSFGRNKQRQRPASRDTRRRRESTDFHWAKRSIRQLHATNGKRGLAFLFRLLTGGL